MSADYYFEALHPDTHEHAAGLAEYRALAAACIADALKCLRFAESWATQLPLITEQERSRVPEHVWKWRRDNARKHHHQLEADIDWFRSRNGYSLWVCATRLTEAEAEALRDEYLRRAEPLYEAYDKALYSVRPRVYR